MEEAAGSAMILPERVRVDLWLFDCTYWSRVAGFVRFTLTDRGPPGGGRRGTLRLHHRPHTQTEEVADALRAEVARVIDADPPRWSSIIPPDNLERMSALFARALFVRTHLPHDEIPAFIPELLRTAST